MKYLVKFVLASFIISAPFGVAQSQNDVLGNNIDLESLQENIDNFGSSSVIVEIESLTISSGQLASMGGEERRVAITSMRNNFFSVVSQDMIDSVQIEYDYVPGFVANIGADELDELRQHPLVKNIYKNKVHKVNLEESLDIVYPDNQSIGFDGGEGWTVAVIDTGVDKSHNFFKTNGTTRVISEACYSGGNLTQFAEIDPLCPSNRTSSTAAGSGVDCKGYDGCDHGTHVAGIAAGNDGVASGANIIAIQVFTGIRDLNRQNLCGTGPGRNCVGAFDSDIIAGLDRVFALRNTHKIAAVNMSLGGGQFFASCNGNNRLMTNIIAQLKSADIATVVASGNDGFNNAISTPACISDAIAVGASSDFTGSLFGFDFVEDQRVFYSNNSSTLDIYAPGSLIRSSVPGNRFENFNGTSMASPHVAGAFAVIKQASSNTSMSEIETLMKTHGPTITVSGVTRRRLSIDEVLETLGVIRSPTITPILQLLFDDEDED